MNGRDSADDACGTPTWLLLVGLAFLLLGCAPTPAATRPAPVDEATAVGEGAATSGDDVESSPVATSSVEASEEPVEAPVTDDAATASPAPPTMPALASAATAGGGCVVGPAHELATAPARRLALRVAARREAALVLWNEGTERLRARPIDGTGQPAGVETATEFGLAHRIEVASPVPAGVLLYSLGRGCGPRGASCDHAIALGWDGAALGPSSDLGHRTSQDAAVLWAATDDGAMLLNHWLWGRPFATRLTVHPEGVRRELVGFMPTGPSVGLLLSQGVLFGEPGFIALTEPHDIPRRLIVMASHGPQVRVDEDVHTGAPASLAEPVVVGLPRDFELRSWFAEETAIAMVFRVGRGRWRFARIGYDGRLIGTPVTPRGDEVLPAPYDTRIVGTVDWSRGRVRLLRHDVIGRPMADAVEVATGATAAAVSWTGEQFVVAYTVVNNGVATIFGTSVTCAP